MLCCFFVDHIQTTLTLPIHLCSSANDLPNITHTEKIYKSNMNSDTFENVPSTCDNSIFKRQRKKKGKEPRKHEYLTFKNTKAHKAQRSCTGIAHCIVTTAVTGVDSHLMKCHSAQRSTIQNTKHH